VPSDPLYGKFDAVLARCIEKFDDTQKQAERSHHDLSILRKFLEGWFRCALLSYCESYQIIVQFLLIQYHDLMYAVLSSILMRAKIFTKHVPEFTVSSYV
jgi:hypothetical protein